MKKVFMIMAVMSVVLTACNCNTEKCTTEQVEEVTDTLTQDSVVNEVDTLVVEVL